MHIMPSFKKKGKEEARNTSIQKITFLNTII